MLNLDWWEALILGIVQGLTEFLPVSSSGHLEIVKELTSLNMASEKSLFLTVLLHLATALSTIVVFRKSIMDIIAGVITGKKDELRFASLIIISMIPATAVGLLFEDQIEQLFSGNMLLVGAALVFTALLLYLADLTVRTDQDINIPKALTVGIAQAIAIIPGISRSGATIGTSILLKIDRDQAAKFSFLMVLPIIIGKAIKDILDAETLDGFSWSQGLIGFLAAFITGIIACTWMIQLVKNSKLRYFALYCIIVGAIAIGYHLFI